MKKKIRTIKAALMAASFIALFASCNSPTNGNGNGNGDDDDKKKPETEMTAEEKETAAREKFYKETICGRYSFYKYHGNGEKEYEEPREINERLVLGSKDFIKEKKYGTMIWTIAEAREYAGDDKVEKATFYIKGRNFISHEGCDESDWSVAGFLVSNMTEDNDPKYCALMPYRVENGRVRVYFQAWGAFCEKLKDGESGMPDSTEDGGAADQGDSKAAGKWVMSGKSGSITLKDGGTWDHENAQSYLEYSSREWSQSGDTVTLTCETTVGGSGVYTEKFTLSGGKLKWKSGSINVNGSEVSEDSSAIMQTVFGSATGELTKE